MSAPPLHIFEHHAMATAFEVRISGSDADYARQAAQECFSVVDRLEGLLSRFQETSEVACINRLQPGETFRVSADTFDCLRLALEMHTLTGGAFDPTLGAVLDRLRGVAAPERSAAPRGRLVLDPATLTVAVQDGAVTLDLGAIGKGFALDRMAEVLREWEIERALLVAGGSSILALAGTENSPGWEITVGDAPTQSRLLLAHRAIGSSGTSVQGEHIIDPVTEQPARGAFRTWAFSDSAAEADALSTAWMVLSSEEIAEVCRLRPGIGAILQRTADTADGLLFLGAAEDFAPTKPPRAEDF